MKALAILIGVLFVGVGLFALVTPESAFQFGHSMLIPNGLLLLAAIRIAIGLVLFLVAKHSRTPWFLRVLGVLIILGGIATAFIGVERAGAVLDWWESAGTYLLRCFAVMAALLGAVIVYSVGTRRLTA